jgi:hypothetical protein
MSVVVQLTKPIVAFPDKPGDTISELNFREPTGADLCDLGVPLKTEGPAFGNLIRCYIMRLAAVPSSAVDQMAVADWMKAMDIITSFLYLKAPEKN